MSSEGPERDRLEPETSPGGSLHDRGAEAPVHVPVMPREVTDFLAPAAGAGPVVDGTAGAGGHAAALLDARPDARLILLDRDPDAVILLRDRFSKSPQVTVLHAAYDRLPELASGAAPEGAAGGLFDLGLSSLQLDSAGRGFSHRLDGPLDMRFDGTAGETASDLLNRLGERELADLIYELGEERGSRRIARSIVAARPLSSTGELARAIRRAARGNPVKVLSRVFQALRIAVNDELGHLERLLSGMHLWTAPGARVAFITFHSLEDRLVKRHFIDSPHFRPAEPFWVVPSEEERRENRRSGPARLRMGLRS